MATSRGSEHFPGRGSRCRGGRIAMDVIEKVLRMRPECGRYLTEALSQRQADGASISSLRLFTFNGTVFTVAGIRNIVLTGSEGRDQRLHGQVAILACIHQPGLDPHPEFRQVLAAAGLPPRKILVGAPLVDHPSEHTVNN